MIINQLLVYGIGMGICIGYFIGAFWCLYIVKKHAKKIGVWKQLNKGEKHGENR